MDRSLGCLHSYKMQLVAMKGDTWVIQRCNTKDECSSVNWLPTMLSHTGPFLAFGRVISLLMIRKVCAGVASKMVWSTTCSRCQWKRGKWVRLASLTLCIWPMACIWHSKVRTACMLTLMNTHQCMMSRYHRGEWLIREMAMTPQSCSWGLGWVWCRSRHRS